MSEIRKDYDEQGNWIGATVTQEVTKTEAALIRSRLKLQVYRTALEQIRDFPKQRGIPGDAGFAANSMVDIARTTLAAYERRSTSERNSPR